MEKTQGLLTSKVRVAKKNLTIPRLELVSGHMVANMLDNTRNVLKRYPVTSCHGWLDRVSGQLPPRQLPPGQLPLDNYPPRTNTPRTFTPLRNFSSTYLGILCTYILHILFFLEDPNIHFMFHIINPFVYCK